MKDLYIFLKAMLLIIFISLISLYSYYINFLLGNILQKKKRAVEEVNRTFIFVQS